MPTISIQANHSQIIPSSIWATLPVNSSNMEASSPLAAMHPPAAPSFGHPDMFRSHSHAAYNGESRGSGILFRDRIKPKNRPDYFNVKGSSPTASLAADLSQNFRLDNEARCVFSPTFLCGNDQITNVPACSPRFPTPRRALFTTNAIMGSLNGRGKTSHGSRG